MFIATLIADGLDEAILSEAAYEFDTMSTAGRLERVTVLDDGHAGDIVFDPAAGFTLADCSPLAEAMKQRVWAIGKGGFGRDLALDIIVQPAEGREKRLLVADMDSTMITVECIDELADYAGIKPQVAAVTEAAMRGELDFEGALDARVALLRGLGEDVLERCHAERVRIMPGARALVRTMRARGGRAVLVSGGFTVFADRVAREIGFDRAVSNRLELEGGRLAGTVARPIVGAAAKRETLLAEAEAMGVPLALTLAVGDGANDIPMIEAAGLGVAYRAKPKTAAAAAAQIEHGDLTALLCAQGIPRAAWVTD